MAPGKSFLDLPQELREIIYKLLLRVDRGFKLCLHFDPLIAHIIGPDVDFSSLLDYERMLKLNREISLVIRPRSSQSFRACQLIHFEARPILYGCNEFGCEIHHFDFCEPCQPTPDGLDNTLSSYSLSQIRHFHTNADVGALGGCYTKANARTKTLLSACTNLRRFGLLTYWHASWRDPSSAIQKFLNEITAGHPFLCRFAVYNFTILKRFMAARNFGLKTYSN